jgi:hypothetical protein
LKKIILTFCILSLISCTKNNVIIENIPFSYGKNNAQPNLVSFNGSISLSWISTLNNDDALLHLTQLKDGKWMKPLTIAKGSDWFINWADFPAHAINQNLILTSYLKKSSVGTYDYDIMLNLRDFSGKKIKEDFLLNTDGFEAEHGFVSIVPNKNQGFFITWLDGRNTTVKDLDGHTKPMTIRFAEITQNGDIINENELDGATCDCCQTSIAMTGLGPIVVYRDRSDKEVRDIYTARNLNGIWEEPKLLHDDGWVINGCPVNGPKAVSNSSNLAIAWFTVVNNKPEVKVSFSNNNGESFGKPIALNDSDAIGRVDVAFLNNSEIIVSYMEFDNSGTYLKIKKISTAGEVSKPITISKIDGGRGSGVPQLEILNNDIFIVWTVSENDLNQLKSVKLNSQSF